MAEKEFYSIVHTPEIIHTIVTSISSSASVPPSATITIPLHHSPSHSFETETTHKILTRGFQKLLFISCIEMGENTIMLREESSILANTQW